MSPNLKKTLVVAALAAAAIAGSAYAWNVWRIENETKGFLSGNGRIEATEIDIATKLPGRIDTILVGEGDFVQAGQTLAKMQVQTLTAQRAEAQAGHEQSEYAVTAAQAQVALRKADVLAAQASIRQREAELDAAQRRLKRSETLTRQGASSEQELDDDRARVRSAQAAVAATQAQAAAAQAAVEAAQAQLVGARSNVTATAATVTRIDADLNDSDLKAPRDGRVQYRVAEPGEVLGGGGRVLNLIDLSDVYLTFFLPEAVAGRVALGSEVHIVLDAAPEFVIPAKVSFVASTAQFTPKTVETASERQKLMFRVKAQIDRSLLEKHLKQVKTGLPGVAWIKTDKNATWPAKLAVKVPE